MGSYLCVTRGEVTCIGNCRISKQPNGLAEEVRGSELTSICRRSMQTTATTCCSVPALLLALLARSIT